ncbi:RNA polymerase sigma factor [Sphingobacterium hungaricum]|uniref:RNA polymerase sigma-70 factor n=1 Tax=Sphingobacterium hungaricum TaxID=2082723 RepID=A0A928YSK6_9SPHI|nr:sigma-70 family RNA polymerase sigma factor [Sphingobacterium hungaricum]MBE8714328.1 RNA polymerase sigma-70 factor [Sphingobacterium hungaricum]
MHFKNIEKSILIDFKKGDVKAFEYIYNMYSKSLYKSLLYLLKDPIEVDEILHNVFLKIWAKKEEIDFEKNLYSYLLKIANSMAIDLLRKNIRTQLLCDTLSQTEIRETASVEETYLKKEEWIMVEEAINLLPPQRKLIFTLFKLEGKSYQEISEQLSISTSTISNQLVLSMKFLRKFIHEHQREIRTLFFLFYFL